MERKQSKTNSNGSKSLAMRERAETKSVKGKENLKDAVEQTKEELADVTDTITNKRGQKDKNYRQ